QRLSPPPSPRAATERRRSSRGLGLHLRSISTEERQEGGGVATACVLDYHPGRCRIPRPPFDSPPETRHATRVPSLVPRRRGGGLALIRPAGPRHRPDRPYKAEPPEAEPGGLLVPRLSGPQEEEDGPVRLRQPQRRYGPRRRRADLVLLPAGRG